MKIKPTPTQKKLKELFDYKEGVLYWKISTAPRVKVGDVAGYFHKATGYFFIMIDGKMYKRHRLIYMMFNGKCPTTLQVDHLNHNRVDDRIENLHLVTEKENHKNQKLNSRNSSGVVGVCWNKLVKGWQAQIKADGVHHHLGIFKDKEEAIRVRKEAEIKMGFSVNHGMI